MDLGSGCGIGRGLTDWTAGVDAQAGEKRMKKTTRRRETADALSLPDLCRFVHADEDWVVELVEEGVLTPVGSHRGN